ncbi:hypothetical protein [Ferrimonas pelagia]|uniref:Nucleoside recognition protein n=1 Tax=Ferrimonas pelagia TaxID=1177826 RepID=A0ABP9EZD4_9GAMM
MASAARQFGYSLKQFFGEVTSVAWTLFKVMIPMLILVKFIEELGGIELLGLWLEPLMNGIGLPKEMGIVWATTLLTNIYGGLLVLMDQDVALSVAQITVLASLMLLAHGLPVEGAIARKAGSPLWVTLLVRIGGGLLFAWLQFQYYSQSGTHQELVQMAWQPEPTGDASLLYWAMTQLQNLAMIVVLITVLMATLKLLKALGIERLMSFMLRPVFKLLGVGQAAANLAIIGITLGVSIGGGLLINEARKGEVSGYDLFITVMLLNLVHSMIEDTLLLLLIGADFNMVFWGRLAFSISLVFLVSLVVRAMKEPTRQRFLYQPVGAESNRGELSVA